MSIKFYLIDNKLTPDPRDRRAVVVSGGNRTLEDVIDEAADSGTMVTKTDIAAVAGIMFKVMAKMLSQGYTITTPLVNMRPSIKGAFANEGSSFDPAEHEVLVRYVMGPLMKEYMAKTEVEKIEGSNKVPRIGEFLDETSGSLESEITPGGMVVMKGSRIAVNPSMSDEGYYFIDASGAETKVDRIAKSTATEVIFKIPDTLSQGIYTFMVRARNQSQELRKSEGLSVEVK